MYAPNTLIFVNIELHLYISPKKILLVTYLLCVWILVLPNVSTQQNALAFFLILGQRRGIQDAERGVPQSPG